MNLDALMKSIWVPVHSLYLSYDDDDDDDDDDDIDMK